MHWMAIFFLFASVVAVATVFDYMSGVTLPHRQQRRSLPVSLLLLLPSQWSYRRRVIHSHRHTHTTATEHIRAASSRPVSRASPCLYDAPPIDSMRRQTALVRPSRAFPGATAAVAAAAVILAIVPVVPLSVCPRVGFSKDCVPSLQLFWVKVRTLLPLPLPLLLVAVKPEEHGGRVATAIPVTKRSFLLRSTTTTFLITAAAAV